MTAFLRACSTELAAALDAGTVRAEIDLFTLILSDGTVLRWTSWDRDVPVADDLWTARGPWLECSGWEVANTMEVPTAKLTLRALNGAFLGGAHIRAQIARGLFDGASFLLTQAYMVTLGTVLGTLDVFSGRIGAIDCDGIKAEITAKGRVNDLDQYAPRNLYQVPCNHGFCDAGCGLNRVDFTTGYTIGASPTVTFLPWSSAPSNPGRYQNGWLSVTSGAASGSRRVIVKADSSGLTLGYPLQAAPSAGDTISAFEGCDKSFDSGSVQSCTVRSNTQHYRGFEFVPPPSAVV